MTARMPAAWACSTISERLVERRGALSDSLPGAEFGDEALRRRDKTAYSLQATKSPAYAGLSGEIPQGVWGRGTWGTPSDANNSGNFIQFPNFGTLAITIPSSLAGPVPASLCRGR